MPAAQDRLENALPEAAERTDDARLPRFVEQELREFLTCDVRARKGGANAARVVASVGGTSATTVLATGA